MNGVATSTDGIPISYDVLLDETLAGFESR
jgi:hypothetical protein